jgi:hypothetical protein
MYSVTCDTVTAARAALKRANVSVEIRIVATICTTTFTQRFA